MEQEKQLKSVIELQVSVKARQKCQGELVEVFQANAKATKVAGSKQSKLFKDEIELKIESTRMEDGNLLPGVSAKGSTKLFKTDCENA